VTTQLQLINIIIIIIIIINIIILQNFLRVAARSFDIPRQFYVRSVTRLHFHH